MYHKTPMTRIEHRPIVNDPSDVQDFIARVVSYQEELACDGDDYGQQQADYAMAYAVGMLERKPTDPKPDGIDYDRVRTIKRLVREMAYSCNVRFGTEPVEVQLTEDEIANARHYAEWLASN